MQKAKGSGMNRVFAKPLPIKEFGKVLVDLKFLSCLPKNLPLDNDSE